MAPEPVPTSVLLSLCRQQKSLTANSKATHYLQVTSSLQQILLITMSYSNLLKMFNITDVYLHAL